MLKSIWSHWPTALGLLVANVLVWAVCRFLFLSPRGATLWQDQMSVIQALVLVDTLLVVWWYTDVTATLAKQSAKQVEVSEKQFGQAWAAERIRHKPFVVAVRVPVSGGGYEYHIRNIGPGLAVSVWHVQDNQGSLSSLCLGALGPGESRALPEALLRPLCDATNPQPFALFAEALWTRTAQWLATVNVRGVGSGSDVFNQFIEVKEANEVRSIADILKVESSNVRAAFATAAATLSHSA